LITISIDKVEKMKKRNVVIVFLSLLILLLFGLPASFSMGPKRVAIIPFTMNADRDLTFLQEGIMDMLASRLAWKGEVEVLEKGVVKKQVSLSKPPINKEKALLIGKSLQADYVIIGSLTVFGESVSIDARILDVANGEELVSAFNQSKGMDNVIPTTDQFARDINEKIMGRYVKSPAPEVVQEERKGPRSLISMEDGLGGEEVGHVQRFRSVFINSDTVFVYKWENNNFVRMRAIEGSWSPKYIYVSVADLDNNGKSEIYVSNLTHSGVSSLALEWDGNEFRPIATKQKWLIRVAEFPGRGKVLVGQQREVDGFFRGPVRFLSRQGDRFVSTGKVELPEFSNVFNFAPVDFSKGNKGGYTVTIGPTEHLRLYDQKYEEMWKSEEYFGGSTTFIEQKESPDVYIDSEWEYLASPLYVTDIDGDGEQEIMVCQNHSGVLRIAKKFRGFTSGTLHFMVFDGAGLHTKWKTRKQSGTIVGYVLADIDNDGSRELVIASVKKGEKLMLEGRSQVIVYNID
jgi:TolB-like protein